MVVQVYESDEILGNSKSEERIIYFESVHHKDKEEYPFVQFVKDCMAKEILIDSFYNLNLTTNLREAMEIVNKDFREEVEKISQEDIADIEKILNGTLVNNKMDFPEEILKAICVYEHEHDYFFYILEGAKGYYGYNWSKNS